MTSDYGTPRSFFSYLVEMDELQLQVRALNGDWDALIATAAKFPEPMAAIWRVIYDYLVTLERPVEGSIENQICAEYVFRTNRRPPDLGPAGQHAFKPSGLGAASQGICQICRNGPNSAIHRPGAPR